METNMDQTQPMQAMPTTAPAANTSGQGKGSEVPAEIKGWNWGAFGLNWIWGLGNGTYIALLCFIPFVNIIMPFVLGAKGSEWAWQNEKWESVEQFKRVQRKWAIAWLILLGVGIGLFLLMLLLGLLTASMQSSPASY